MRWVLIQPTFFAPEAEPYNPFITAEQRASLIMFGKPTLNGLITMELTTLPASVRCVLPRLWGQLADLSWRNCYDLRASVGSGLIATRYDGSQFSYAETVRNHFVASLATIETVAGNRQKLLQQFYEYRRSAIEIG